MVRVKNMFANDARPGGVLKFKDELSEAEFNRLREAWRKQYTGPSNAHRVAVIAGRRIGGQILADAWRIRRATIMPRLPRMMLPRLGWW